MATAMASSHMRMRPQLPMLTTSDTAPMVQKLVRLATAPKTRPSANPPHATRPPRFEVPPKEGTCKRRTDILSGVARRILQARAFESFAPQAAGFAGAAGAACRVGLVAGDRERKVHAQLVPVANDLVLAHADDRALDADRLSLDGAPRG